MNILIGANVLTAIVLVGILAYKHYANRAVPKSDFEGLTEYKTKTGTSLYCLQGGGQKRPVNGEHYGTGT